jgi:hypothetical protein
MRSKADTGLKPGARRFARRGFLSTLGAGGLTAAATLFGRVTPAQAASCGCCNLVYCPPNTTMSSCRSVSHYLWGCSINYYLHCSCCEKKRSDGTYYASAYSCQYG